jgi:hypothetical protein
MRGLQGGLKIFYKNIENEFQYYIILKEAF